MSDNQQQSTRNSDIPVTSTDGAAALDPKTGGLWNYFKQHPIGFWFFFWGEFAERCCFYGAKVILPLFIVQVIGRTQQQSQQTVYIFVAACYFAPIIGGWIADNYLGKYRTILFFSIPYIIGQWLLVFGFLHTQTILYMSLVLLALGSGVIKPNISTLMGMTYDQKCPGKTTLRSDAFSMFYMAINIGSALSTFAMPAVRDYYGRNSFGYGMAFMFPAILMMIALFIFAIGKPYYAEETIWRKQKLTDEQKRERMETLKRIAGLFGVITVFWMIFDQSQVTWTFTSRDCIHLELFGHRLGPDQIQAMNPLFIVIFVPVITLLWHWFAHRGREVKATQKMVFGFILTAVSMLIMAYVGFSAQSASHRVVSSSLLSDARNAFDVCMNEKLPFRDAEVTLADGTMANKWWRPDATPRILAKDADDATFMTTMNAAAGAATEQSLVLARLVQEGDPADPTLVGRINAEIAVAETLSGGQLARNVKPVFHDGMSEAEKNAELVATARRDAALQKRKRTRLATEEDAAAAGSMEEAEAFAALWGLTEVVNNAAGRSIGDAQRHAARDASMVISYLDTATDKARDAIRAIKVGNYDAYRTRANMTVLFAAESAAAFIDLTGDIAGGEDLYLKTAEAKTSVWWLILAFFMITIAEICISIVGLELAFAIAPPSMKSFVSGCWLATVGIANLFNAWVASFCDCPLSWIDMTHGAYYTAFVILLIPMTWLLVIIGRRFNSAKS